MKIKFKKEIEFLKQIKTEMKSEMKISVSLLKNLEENPCE